VGEIGRSVDCAGGHLLERDHLLEVVLKPSVGSNALLFSSVDFAHNRVSEWVLARWGSEAHFFSGALATRAAIQNRD